MNNVIKFLIENYEIIVYAIIVAIMIVMWFCGKKKVVKSVLLQMIIEAEEKYGSGTGPIKHTAVVGWIKAKFPTIFLFIGDKTLDKWITDMVQYMQMELKK